MCSHGKVDILVVPSLQVSKLRLREAQRPARSHSLFVAEPDFDPRSVPLHP